MLDKLVNRVKKELGYRSDFFVMDSRPLTSNAHFVLCGYSGDTPEVTDVRNFVVKAFKGSIYPVNNSIRFYDFGKSKGFSVVVERNRVTKKAEAALNMTCLAKTMFLDTELNQIWQMQENSDGTKYLVRSEEEDLENIINRAKSRVVSYVRASVNDTKVVGRRNYEVGDTVEFYDDSKLWEGEVKSLINGQVKVKIGNETKVINSNQIIRIVDLSKGRAKNEDVAKLDFYTKAYGKEYALKLLGLE